MKFFLDTEFIEDGRTIDLLSIGVVAEDGRELYVELAETDRSKAGPWVRENVLPHLAGPTASRAEVARRLLEFVGEGVPEFWWYYADYDWVALCQVFGTMMDLPAGWPMYCRDLKQWSDFLGNPELPTQASTEHHALADARWNRDVYAFLERRDATHAIERGILLASRNGALSWRHNVMCSRSEDGPAEVVGPCDCGLDDFRAAIARRDEVTDG